MTCDEVRSRLSWFLDGELDPADAQALRDHVAACGKCGALAAEMKSCDDEIRSALEGVKPAAGFSRRVARAARRRQFSWRRLLVAAAASFFILLGGSSIYVNTRQAPPLQISIHGLSGFHADSMGALRVFVQNAASQAPIANAAVRVFLGGTAVGDFLTNAAGSIDGFFKVPDLADGSYPLKIEVRSEVGDETLEKPVSVRREYRLMLTTDKPMYQPGQPIQMRALALNAFTLKPRSGDATFEVVDSKGNRVFSRKVALSEFGIGSAEMTLADELNLGTYQIAVTASGLRQERTVEVAKYVLPKFKLELEPSKESYRPDERVRGTVRAKYFFGKPVHGRVQAKLAREVVTGELREDGSWEFEVPAPDEGTYPVEVTVTDTADHKETKASAVVVSREPLKVTLYPEGGVLLWGQPNVVYAIVATADGRPVKADLRLIVDGKPQEVSSDDLGVAKVMAQQADVRLEWARDKAGNETRQQVRPIQFNASEFLIRLDKPAYKGGETMTVKVVGNPREPVYIDVIKGGQLLLAKASGPGDVAIDLPPDLFGTVQVVAYTRNSAQPVVRLAYVNLPEGLQIRPRPAKATFRPGEEMPVDFEVVDRAGKPVQAALGISVVDEALFGLVESKIASEKAWLSLAPELIDTRGFLKADANEIYQSRAANAQGFVSGNSHASRPPVIAQNSYEVKAEQVRRFREDYNEMIFKVFMGALVVTGIGVGGFILVAILRTLASVKFSGLAVITLIGLTILIMILLLPMSASRDQEAVYPSVPMEASPPSPEAVVAAKPRVQFEIDEERAVPTAIPREPEAKDHHEMESRTVFLPAKSEPARVRSYFPETLYWQPQVITNANGHARLTLPAADSITSWRLLSNAIARNGALGFDQANLRVFQDFFVDLDVPVALTKGDRVHVPVAVYNYLKEPQTVAVRIQREPWFELLDEESRSVALKAGEVSVVYFGLKVKEHGRKALTVFADGAVKDAIRRSIEVMEKGREIPVTASDRVNGRKAFRVEIPERAIDGASVLFVRMTPGMSDLVTGLEGMIRMPNGCFEQTLSSAYPNVALHQYLKESGQLTKETEKRLMEAHSVGFQRLLSFEAPGGGFGWYPGQEPKALLTAYGVMFLADLAKVYSFDPAVLGRSIAWLERLQDAEGRWFSHDHGGTWARLSSAAIPSTAWVAWAMKRAGRDDTRPLGRAEEFLRKADLRDAYEMALVANAFPTKANLDRLASMAKNGVWNTSIPTWTRGRDAFADLETTALAVMALARHNPALADEAAGWIIRSRDPYGAWGSTQPTVLALRALAAVGGGSRDKVGARLSVNGKELPNAFAESDAAQSVDLSPHLVKGANEIAIETSRRVNIQVAGRYYVPWGAEDMVRGVEGLKFQVAYDKTEVKVGETVTCTVTVEADAFAMMAEVAIPPGFTVDSSALDDLVRRKLVDKVGQNGRALVFYLPGKGGTFSYPLRPRYPLKVSVARSVAYEYYTPSRRVIAPPQDLEVRE